MFDLRDAAVALTGAAGGIGRATARALSARGARVALIDRDVAGLRALAAELGDAASVWPFDLTRFDQLDALAGDIARRHGAVNALINNAGLTVFGPFASQSVAEIERVFDVDLRAAVLATRAFLPHIQRAGRGHISFVSSMAGAHAFPAQATYSGAKFGLRGFAAALRIELAAEGIGVSCVL